MLTLNIKINGKTERDLTSALEEVTRKLKDGFTNGFDRNDEGNYSFEVSGEEEFEDEVDIKDVMYFKTDVNEHIKLERFMNETFEIFHKNSSESFVRCIPSDINKRVKKGMWIEIDESEYKSFYKI